MSLENGPALSGTVERRWFFTEPGAPRRQLCRALPGDAAPPPALPSGEGRVGGLTFERPTAEAEFLRAVRSDDVVLTGKLLASSRGAELAALRTTEGSSSCALHIAARSGRLALCALLSGDAAVDVDAVDADGSSALSLACRSRHGSVARALLESGARNDVADRRGLTPFLYVSQMGHAELARLLVESTGGACLGDVVASTGDTALHLAASYGRTDAVAALLDVARAAARGSGARKEGGRGIGSGSTDGSGGRGSGGVGSGGGSRGSRDSRGSRVGGTPNSGGAVRREKSPLLQLLLATTGMGRSALCLAVTHNHLPVVKLLLQADKEACGGQVGATFGHPAVFLAADNGAANVMALLLKIIPSVGADEVDQYGDCLLKVAALAGHAGTVRALLARGASPATPDRQGLVALHFAASMGHAECVRLLGGT
jgi:ankyrin repeat protein